MKKSIFVLFWVPALFAEMVAWEPGGVPYEIVRAGRMQDDHPPLISFEDHALWHVTATNAVAQLSSTADKRLFGKGAVMLTYRALPGADKLKNRPIVYLTPEKPIALPPDANALSIWVYGNNNYGKGTNNVVIPSTTLFAEFADGSGGTCEAPIEYVNHREWFKGIRILDTNLLAKVRAGGNKLVGFQLRGGLNTFDATIYLTSFCAYRDELKPLTFTPRAKRGVQLFPDAPQGINTGKGALPFPNSTRTILPPQVESDVRLEFHLPKDPASSWDDLAFRWQGGNWIRLAVGGGVWPQSARKNARVTFHREGNSLVADIVVKGGTAEEVRFGGMDEVPFADTIPVPYITFRKPGLDRPTVISFRVGDTPLFLSAFADWTQSAAAEPFSAIHAPASLAANGGMRYTPKTDGTRNDVYERFVWTISPDFAATLPTISNPVSPWKHVTGKGVWLAWGAGKDRAADENTWRRRARTGLRHLIITDHESMWRDGNESFTFRTDPAPLKGGDKVQRAYTRALIDELGYRYGPYNNFTDFAPVNAHWNADWVSRTSDNQLQNAWYRCYAPKPLRAVEACERLSPIIQAKFGFNTAYCDVHTATTPWTRTDYDARVPGAATFAQTFYCYGEIMLLQRKAWNGPVYSEGGSHWFYCGLTDGNYAQDSLYRIAENPWLVDFDLLRLHPLCCNFGMGNLEMFWGDGRVPQDRTFAHDRFLAATIAFGHPGFLLMGSQMMPELQSYCMVQGVAARYTLANAAEIRYGDNAGKFHTTSEAIALGAWRENRVSVRYTDGTRVMAFGGKTNEAPWGVMLQGEKIFLPPNGFAVLTGDGKAASVSALVKEGKRADVAFSEEYVYVNGRGTFTSFAGGGADGILARFYKSPTNELVVCRQGTQVELPYRAKAIEAFNYQFNFAGNVPFTITNGVTRFRPQLGYWTLNVIREPGTFAPPASTALAPFTRAKIPARAQSSTSAMPLPFHYAIGMRLKGGADERADETCGSRVYDKVSVCGNVAHPSIFMHPPYRGRAAKKPGLSFAQYTIVCPDIPEVTLPALVGKADGSSVGDGIYFRIEVADANGGNRKVLAARHVTKHAWEPIEANLSEYRGKPIRIYLISDCGPKGDTSGDWAAWVTFPICGKNSHVSTF